MYFSHDYPTDELISIHCSDEKIFHHKSPSCKAETSYRPAPDLVTAKHIEGAISIWNIACRANMLAMARDRPEAQILV